MPRRAIISMATCARGAAPDPASARHSPAGDHRRASRERRAAARGSGRRTRGEGL